MGILDSCLACLCGRGDDVYNDGETSRLLHDDYRLGYGSQRAGGAFQPDSESMRREREALDGICHSMSDSIEDLFLAKSSSHHHNMNGHNNRSHASAASSAGNEDSTSRPRTPDLGQVGSQEVALRTIRKGRSGPISNALRRQGEGWKAVQDAIG